MKKAVVLSFLIVACSTTKIQRVEESLSCTEPLKPLRAEEITDESVSILIKKLYDAHIDCYNKLEKIRKKIKRGEK